MMFMTQSPYVTGEKRMKKYLIILVCALFTVTAATALAQDLTGYGFGHGEGDITEDADPAHAPQDVRISITGTVKKTFAGVAINAVDGQYLVYGEDLSSMVDKTVTAWGDASRANGGRKIFVISYKEVKSTSCHIVQGFSCMA
jgi:hypothetical protein